MRLKKADSFQSYLFFYIYFSPRFNILAVFSPFFNATKKSSNVQFIDKSGLVGKISHYDPRVMSRYRPIFRDISKYFIMLQSVIAL